MTTSISVNGTPYRRNPLRAEKRNDGFFHRRVDVGGVSLHVAEARPSFVEGDDVPKDVPLVVLLHGFPEFWWAWREQLRALSEAGCWVVAPDMRGYNESDKPEGIGAYEVEKLVGDVAGLIKALGREKAYVVGHDWGGGVAWMFAHEHHEMLERLAILNVPHPLEMMRGLRRPKQLRKSWYMFFFQLPRVPEWLLSRNDFEYARKLFQSSGFDREAVEHYIDALRVPRAATSAINYYRAAIRRAASGRVPKQRMKPIERPVLVIWGDRDDFLGKEMADPPKRFVPNARVVHIPRATHWVQNDAPEEVNRLLVELLEPALR